MTDSILINIALINIALINTAIANIIFQMHIIFSNSIL